MEEEDFTMIFPSRGSWNSNTHLFRERERETETERQREIVGICVYREWERERWVTEGW